MSVPKKIHPLDPLSAIEISKTSRLIREYQPNNSGWIFNSITLLEPSKNVLLPFLSIDSQTYPENIASIPRKSFTILIEKGTGNVYEAVVNLSDEKIERFDAVPAGFQPTLTPEDCIEAEKICKSDSKVRKRCFRLGLENMDLIVADPWSIGYNGEPEFEGKRVIQLFMYARMFPEDNHYAHPLDFVVVVDMNAVKVIQIEDLPIHTDFKSKREEDLKIPTETSNYDPKLLPEGFVRTDLKPLQVVQPEGPSFTVEGNEIQWQLWNFRISFNYREGLVLHNVSYKDGPSNKTRPLIYRISLSEMVVPYGHPRPSFHRKSDGTISFEVKATGELSTNLLADGGSPANHGTIVFDRVAGQYHQHIFCARIDPMIDSINNTISVVDVKALEEPCRSERNPYGQGFTVEETPFKTSMESVTDVKAETSRFWKISNYSSIHPYTQKPVGWKLMPTGASFQRLLAGPESYIRKRAGFAMHSVWVTPYDDNQLYAGGLYINQSPGGQGLESWVNENGSIEDEDIVLYHSFGVTHIPRVEDFPIMPVETFGYSLKPVNFFLGNPGLSPCKSVNKSTLADAKLE